MEAQNQKVSNNAVLSNYQLSIQVLMEQMQPKKFKKIELEQKKLSNKLLIIDNFYLKDSDSWNKTG